MLAPAADTDGITSVTPHSEQKRLVPRFDVWQFGQITGGTGGGAGAGAGRWRTADRLALAAPGAKRHAVSTTTATIRMPKISQGPRPSMS